MSYLQRGGSTAKGNYYTSNKIYALLLEVKFPYQPVSQQGRLQGLGTAITPHPILAPYLAPPHLSAPPKLLEPHLLLRTIEDKSDKLRIRNSNEKLAPHLNLWLPAFLPIWGGVSAIWMGR